MDHFAAMQRLHEKEEREREAKKLALYAAQVAANPPKVDSYTRYMCLAAAACAAQVPGCEHSARKLEIKYSAGVAENESFLQTMLALALKEREALVAARKAEDPEYVDSEGED